MKTKHLKMKNILCYFLDHDWRFNFSSVPDKCICTRCSTKEQLNLVNLKWEEVKSFSPELGTDDELKKRWYKSQH